MASIAALIVLCGAALVAAVADRPPTDRGSRWRFPVVTVLIAAADAGLAVTATTWPDRQIGLFALLSAGLLVYGTHRRLRVVRGA
ncbi:hypothetical protein [Streptomyces decoyicus]|uniref:hypothetical protein n=1 Tax=Streptomyces decoyicus TaxID=249567 RepID=UPI0038668BDA|nr:hypothetical protein OG532_40490 [Streptomyces decoyicus]